MPTKYCLKYSKFKSSAIQLVVRNSDVYALASKLENDGLEVKMEREMYMARLKSPRAIMATITVKKHWQSKWNLENKGLVEINSELLDNHLLFFPNGGCIKYKITHHYTRNEATNEANMGSQELQRYITNTWAVCPLTRDRFDGHKFG